MLFYQVVIEKLHICGALVWLYWSDCLSRTGAFWLVDCCAGSTMLQLLHPSKMAFQLQKELFTLWCTKHRPGRQEGIHFYWDFYIAWHQCHTSHPWSLLYVSMHFGATQNNSLTFTTSLEGYHADLAKDAILKSFSYSSYTQVNFNNWLTNLAGLQNRKITFFKCRFNWRSVCTDPCHMFLISLEWYFGSVPRRPL